MVIQGCNNDNSLGEAPSGSVKYTNIGMPSMQKSSQNFNIVVYKDAQLT